MKRIVEIIKNYPYVFDSVGLHYLKTIWLLLYHKNISEVDIYKGYLTIVKSNGYRTYFHRDYYYWFNDREKIEDKRHVHHIDTVKTNTHIINLVALSVEDHDRVHKGEVLIQHFIDENLEDKFIKLQKFIRSSRGEL